MGKKNIPRIGEKHYEKTFSKQELVDLLSLQDPTPLFEKADRVRQQFVGNGVYLRALIEFSNHCKNDCLYCGIRRSNRDCERYRLTKEQILSCCEEGYELGYRTFVLQGGEDPYYSSDKIASLVEKMTAQSPAYKQIKRSKDIIPMQSRLSIRFL